MSQCHVRASWTSYVQYFYIACTATRAELRERVRECFGLEQDYSLVGLKTDRRSGLPKNSASEPLPLSAIGRRVSLRPLLAVEEGKDSPPERTGLLAGYPREEYHVSQLKSFETLTATDPSAAIISIGPELRRELECASGYTLSSVVGTTLIGDRVDDLRWVLSLRTMSLYEISQSINVAVARGAAQCLSLILHIHCGQQSPADAQCGHPEPALAQHCMHRSTLNGALFEAIHHGQLAIAQWLHGRWGAVFNDNHIDARALFLICVRKRYPRTFQWLVSVLGPPAPPFLSDLHWVVSGGGVDTRFAVDVYHSIDRSRGSLLLPLAENITAMLTDDGMVEMPKLLALSLQEFFATPEGVPHTLCLMAGEWLCKTAKLDRYDRLRTLCEAILCRPRPYHHNPVMNSMDVPIDMRKAHWCTDKSTSQSVAPCNLESWIRLALHYALTAATAIDAKLELRRRTLQCLKQRRGAGADVNVAVMESTLKSHKQCIALLLLLGAVPDRTYSQFTLEDAHTLFSVLRRLIRDEERADQAIKSLSMQLPRLPIDVMRIMIGYSQLADGSNRTRFSQLLCRLQDELFPNGLLQPSVLDSA